MALDLDFICEFLGKMEGFFTVGYIPCYLKAGGSANYKGGPNPDRYEAMGQSGVTIATGCDLGQTDAKTLAAYGLCERIIGIYAPYLGKRKDRAIRQLHAAPLAVSYENARATDQAVHGGYLRRSVIPVYEKDSGKKFADIPREAQAVIMSICFQKGVGGTRRGAPKTWKHLCEGNWQAAANELLTGFTQYKSRRQAEGRLLARPG